MENPEQARYLSQETTYAVYFARKLVGDQFIAFTRAIGNKNIIHTSHKSADGKSLDALDNWGNVARHCLICSIICDVLGEKTELSEEIRKSLRIVAFLHDAYKKTEIILRGRTDKPSEKMERTDHFERIQQSAINQGLIAVGIEPEKRKQILFIIQGTGPGSLLLTHRLLEKGWPNLTNLEKAQVIMHVADDTTINDRLGDFAARIAKNRANPAYQFENKASPPRVNKDFKQEDITSYSQPIFGENGLTEEEIQSFASEEITNASPNYQRILEVIGFRARRVIAQAMGIEEENLNKTLAEAIIARQEDFSKRKL